MDILTGYNTGYTGNKHIPRGDKVRPINIKQAHRYPGGTRSGLSILNKHIPVPRGDKVRHISILNLKYTFVSILYI